MNYKLFLIGYFVSCISFDGYCMQQQQAILRHNESNYSTNMDVVMHMMNSTMLRTNNLDLENRDLSQRVADLTARLDLTTVALNRVEAEVQTERERTIAILQGHTQERQNLDNTKHMEMQRLQQGHHQELMILQQRHTRQLLVTFVTTAATAVGITWVLHKLKIL